MAARNLKYVGGTLGATDLYTAGLGAEIAGAVLLAKGLLLSPPQLFDRSRSALDFNPKLVIGLCEDRVDGLFGIRGIAAGFTAQLAGYLVSLTTAPARHGTEAALVALACAGVAVVLVAAPWSVLRSAQVRKEIRRVGLHGVPQAHDLSSATVLAVLAQELGYGRTMTGGNIEPDNVFAGRVFGEELPEPDPRDALRHIRPRGGVG